MSLWVVMMVPVVVFASVAAMASPERLAAERSLRDASDDIASVAFAVERRLHAEVFADGLGLPTIAAACDSEPVGPGTETELKKLLKNRIDVRKDLDTKLETAKKVLDTKDADLKKLLDDDGEQPDTTDPNYEQYIEDTRAFKESTADYNALAARINSLPNNADVDFAHKLCNDLMGQVYAGLSQAGFDVTTLQGFHTNAAPLGLRPRVAGSHGTSWLLCTAKDGAKEDEDAESSAAKPSGADGVYAVLVAEWNSSSWVAAQVWPEGITLVGEGLRLADEAHSAPPPADDDTECMPARDFVAERGGELNRHLIDAGVLPPAPPAPPQPTTDGS